MPIKLKTLDVDGSNIDIFVNDSGRFTAVVDGNHFHSSDLKQIERQIVDTARKINRVSIEAAFLSCDLDDGEVDYKPITLVGIHAGNKNVLYREGTKGQTEQLRWSDGITRRVSAAELKQLIALGKTARRARQAVEEWLNARKLNPIEAIRATAVIGPNTPTAWQAEGDDQ